MARNERIVRSISPERFDAFLQDFEFLFERIRLERGELDLRLRNNYFNLYHRGNSLVRVDVRFGPYPMKIHKAFADGIFSEQRFGTPRQHGDYIVFTVPAKLLNAFLSKTHIERLASRIAERNYGEEITFEQMLITDNMNREDFYIIDRQVCGGPLSRKKTDLLALEQVAEGSRQYRLVLLEAKLGCNEELSGKVGAQLDHYLGVMNSNFGEFKECYEATYAQMRRTGIFISPSHDVIEIVPPVTGWVVVGGYSGIAQNAIIELRKKFPSIKVKPMFHRW